MKHETKIHIFAVLAPEENQPLAQYSTGATVHFANKDFIFRIVTILRLNVESTIVIFDRTYHLECKITEITKKGILCIIQKKNENKHNLPEITCIIPLLKREALENLIDSLTQLGATTIQLITTQKAHRVKQDQKEFERLQRIIHAAAEQSKNYCFPIIRKAEPLMNITFTAEAQNTIFLDPEGQSCFEIITKLKSVQPKNITLIIGPEGDLTTQEKAFLQEKKVVFMRLTQTILRAEQAAALALGIIRSIFNNQQPN